MTAGRGTLPHLRALDGLRGVAVGAVLLFHAGHLTGGYLGVDVFFVLSGFLITTLLLREESETGRIRLGAFWGRRARRLLPALALVLFAVAAWAATQPADAITGLRGDALATIAYVANWHAIVSGADYWALFRSSNPLEHTWSLAIEEQFYLVWPLVVLALATAGRESQLSRRVLVVALSGTAASWVLMQIVFDPASTARAYYATDTRAGSVLIGAALASWIVRRPAPSARLRRTVAVAGVVGAIALTAAAVTLAGDDALLYRIGFLGCAIATASIIATAVLVPGHVVSRVLGFPPLVALGIISYGVYLWHWPVDVVLDSGRTGLDGWTLFAVQSAATLAIAAASFFLVERPIRAGFGSRRFWLIAAPLTAVVLVGATLAATLSVPASGTDTATGTPFTREGVFLEGIAIDRQAGPHATRILLGGDSLAFTLADQSRFAPRLGVANLGVLGCGITPGAPVGPRAAAPQRVCAQWPRGWRLAAEMLSPRAIVLLSGVWDLWPLQRDGRTVGLYSRAHEAAVRQGLDEALGIAERTRVPLVILTVPCLHPDAAATARVGSGLDEPRRRRWLNGVYRRFAADTPAVHLLEFGDFACGLGADAFSDGVHFSASGARAAWAWLAPRLAPLLGAPPTTSTTTAPA